MATRAHTIINNLVTKLEATTLDEQAGSSDKFRHHPGLDPSDGMMARDRSFVLAPNGVPIRDPRYISATTPAIVSIELGLGVAYQQSKNIKNRILRDSERLLDTLESFQADYSSDILEVDIASGNIDPLERTIIVEYVINVTYSLDLS